MFSIEDTTTSTPQSNKTINCKAAIQHIQERESDLRLKDAVQTFWPSSEFVKCNHIWPREPGVGICIEGQTKVADDGLLLVTTNFNNLSILRNSILDKDTVPLKGSFTAAHIKLIQEYNDGMWYGERYELADRIYDDMPKLNSPITPTDVKKLLQLNAMKRADNGNKWIESNYQFMCVMKTEAMLEENRTRFSQNPAGWMGGVCDVYHNNINLDKMIEVGQELYYRFPEIMPKKDANNMYDGDVVGEQTSKNGFKFPGCPEEKVTLILEVFKDSVEFCKRRFMTKFALELINYGRNLEMTRPQDRKGKYYDVAEYHGDLQDETFRKPFIRFQDDYTKFNEMRVGKAYKNAFYGEMVTTNLASKIIF